MGFYRPALEDTSSKYQIHHLGVSHPKWNQENECLLVGKGKEEPGLHSVEEAIEALLYCIGSQSGVLSGDSMESP